MPIGNSDFSRDFLAGAQIGNMRVAQQERMMQLRSQAALNAIHERQLAAQADMLAQHASLYRQQADKLEEAQKQEAADLAASNDLFHYDTEVMGLDPDTALQNRISVMSVKNPALAQKMAGAYLTVKKAQNPGGAGTPEFTPRVETIEGPDGPLNVFRKSPHNSTLLPDRAGPTSATPVRDENNNVLGYTIPGANGPHLLPKSPASQMAPADKAEMTHLYKTIDNIDTELRKLPAAANQSDADVAERERLVGLKEQATRRLRAFQNLKPGAAPQARQTPAAVAPKLELKVGVRYRNKEGDERVYRGKDEDGNPIWEETD